MKLIRFFVGRILLLLNAVFKPKALPRTEAEIIQLKQDAQGLSLYQFEACPFCIKVRRALTRLGVTIPIYDVKRSRSMSESSSSVVDDGKYPACALLMRRAPRRGYTSPRPSLII